MTLTVLTACRVPPRGADPSLPDRTTDAALLTAPEIRLHIACLGDARIPDEALNGTLAILSKHIRRPIRIIRHPPKPMRMSDAPGFEPAALFPIYRNGRELTSEDLPHVDPADNRAPVCRLDAPSEGILGAVGVRHAEDPATGRMWYFLRPMVEPDTILVVVSPGSADGRGHTGYSTLVADSDGASLRTGMVVLRQSAIRRRSSFLVPERRLWQWTLTHEIGHVLRVPASNAHGCLIDGYGGIHCTHPECVMTTGVSWRIILSGILNGWPMDFCDRCAAEIAAAYNPALTSTKAASTPSVPTP